MVYALSANREAHANGAMALHCLEMMEGVFDFRRLVIGSMILKAAASAQRPSR